MGLFGRIHLSDVCMKRLVIAVGLVLAGAIVIGLVTDPPLSTILEIIWGVSVGVRYPMFE